MGLLQRLLIVAGLVGASIFTTTNDKQISLSYVEWDTEVASTCGCRSLKRYGV